MEAQRSMMNSAGTSGRAGTGIQVYPTQGPCCYAGHHFALGVWFSSNFTTHPHDMAAGEGVGGGTGRGGVPRNANAQIHTKKF